MWQQQFHRLPSFSSRHPRSLLQQVVGKRKEMLPQLPTLLLHRCLDRRLGSVAKLDGDLVLLEEAQTPPRCRIHRDARCSVKSVGIPGRKWQTLHRVSLHHHRSSRSHLSRPLQIFTVVPSSRNMPPLLRQNHRRIRCQREDRPLRRVLDPQCQKPTDIDPVNQSINIIGRKRHFSLNPRDSDRCRRLHPPSTTCSMTVTRNF